LAVLPAGGQSRSAEIGAMRTRAGFVALLMCVAAAPPAQLVLAAPSQQQPPLSAAVRSKIDTDVRALLSAAHAQGATIAVVQGGAIVYTRGYGLRDVAKSLPADARTRYEIGSITKQFTAAAILQLKEAGKIDLDATVATYLPSVSHAKEITIRQLLTHTSGLPDYVGIQNFETLAATPATFDQLMSRISGMPLGFAPGAQFRLLEHELFDPRADHRTRLGPELGRVRPTAPLRTRRDDGLGDDGTRRRACRHGARLRVRAGAHGRVEADRRILGVLRRRHRLHRRRPAEVG
jgi:Beta-lactamase